ncbi:hypothetical protein SO802_017671 [Lithocarpus litseifolius]|uniref:Uncharacterized protein n=1 Tax=Lithocarpus litseifolius TaxID=425828 RepID=A0AAW2CK16_9ROSI
MMKKEKPLVMIYSEDNEIKDSDSDDSVDSHGGENDNEDSDSKGSDSEDYGSRDNHNAGAFYEDDSYDKVDCYDEALEDDEEAVGGDYNEYPYGRPSNWSCITDVKMKEWNVVSQSTSLHPSNKGKQDLFREWMDNIERLDGYVVDKPADMEVNGEGPDYMDEDPRVLMLKEERNR